ncbi:hypothetical protein NDU88_003657 [Pleurodeles waltl]|uniref:DDE Tnp4 domain-containing protein n=1 Tax=Pleurodeles waltl TaxID=8319 RepID=A0AAV7RFU9_PLEWA|nr:hypothetical protein NDU88_003657 [Pleurodeles waltl]
MSKARRKHYTERKPLTSRHPTRNQDAMDSELHVLRMLVFLLLYQEQDRRHRQPRKSPPASDGFPLGMAAMSAVVPLSKHVAGLVAVLAAVSVAEVHVSAPVEGHSRTFPAAPESCQAGGCQVVVLVVVLVVVQVAVLVAVQVAVFTAVQVDVVVERRGDSSSSVGATMPCPHLLFGLCPFSTFDGAASVLTLSPFVLEEPLVAGRCSFTLPDVGTFFTLAGGGMSLASLGGTLAALMGGALDDPAVAGTTVPGDLVTEVTGLDLESLALGEELGGRARLLGQVMRWRHLPVYRYLVDLSTMEERHIIITYRLDCATILELCAQLEPELMSAIRHPTGLPLLVQVLAVLHFLASGSFQTTVAMASGMSQPMFSNVSSRVLSAMLKHMRSYNVFPQVEDLPKVKGDFYALGHITNIIGAIDGTHVAFAPRRNEQVYRNRKSYHSLNVQVVCLADQYISHVNAKYPGSVHDAYILSNNSIPYVVGQLLRHHVWLIGEPKVPTQLT